MLQLSEEEANRIAERVDFKKMGDLVPAVVQDASSEEVLMQAFMNREALVKTVTSGKVHFWSRSRNGLWLKGEESGHFSLVQNLSLDCDSDSILLRVNQIGVCCHTGQMSCFHKPITAQGVASAPDGRILEKIEGVIVERIRQPRQGSYVSQLIAAGEDALPRKIGEESLELILADRRSSKAVIVNEAADLLFHTLILLTKNGIPISDVFAELNRRHMNKTKADARTGDGTD